MPSRLRYDTDLELFGYGQGYRVARTRSREYDAIQQHILDRTAAVFATRGYAGASIGDIADACGCSKSRLYHYFDSKEAILSTMLTDHVDKLLANGAAAIRKHTEPIPRFRALIRSFLEIYPTASNKHIVLLTCMEFLPDELRIEIYNKQRQLITMVRNILRELKPKSVKKRPLLGVDTMFFFGMINWTYTWYKIGGPVLPDEIADRSVELFLNGYLNAK